MPCLNQGEFSREHARAVAIWRWHQGIGDRLLVAQMLSLRRCTELVQAMSGIKLSEATGLGYMHRLYDLLEPWETGAKEKLLTRPALHVDETGVRVNKKNWWMHVATDGYLTLKYLHRKRGKEAIDAFGIIPFYCGTLIHDRWAAYFAYVLCKHQVCRSHLLRDLTFICRLQQLPLGALDAQFAARDLPRGQPERDRGAERGRMPEVSKKV